MGMAPLMALTIVLAISAVPDARAAPQRWTRTATTAHFSLDQPMGWQKVSGTSGDEIGIISGACRTEGVIICRGEAMISVSSKPVIAKPKTLASTACWSLEETRSETKDNPGAITQNTELSCTIADRRFVIVEHHWKGDKRAASYGRIAMRMAKSLRYPG